MSENLVIEELQDIRKVATEKNNIFPCDAHIKIVVHSNQTKYQKTLFPQNECTGQAQQTRMGKI